MIDLGTNACASVPVFVSVEDVHLRRINDEFNVSKKEEKN